MHYMCLKKSQRWREFLYQIMFSHLSYFNFQMASLPLEKTNTYFKKILIFINVLHFHVYFFLVCALPRKFNQMDSCNYDEHCSKYFSIKTYQCPHRAPTSVLASSALAASLQTWLEMGTQKFCTPSGQRAARPSLPLFLGPRD